VITNIMDISSPINSLMNGINNTTIMCTLSGAVLDTIVDTSVEATVNKMAKQIPQEKLAEDKNLFETSLYNSIHQYQNLSLGIHVAPNPLSLPEPKKDHPAKLVQKNQKLNIACISWIEKKSCPYGEEYCPFEHYNSRVTKNTNIEQLNKKLEEAKKEHEAYEFRKAIKLYTVILMEFQLCLKLEDLMDILGKRSVCYFYVNQIEEMNLDNVVKSNLMNMNVPAVPSQQNVISNQYALVGSNIWAAVSNIKTKK